MNRLGWLLVVSAVVLVVGAFGCKSEGTTGTTTPTTAEAEYPFGGQKFDPPIAKSEVPEGSYFCDMGNVHYHQKEEGSGTCPICKMKLKKKEAGAE